MGVDSKNVLLANGAWYVLLGGGFALLQDKMLDGYGVDISTSMSAREQFIHGAIGRCSGIIMSFMGFIPLFVMAKAKPQTLKNLCFAFGIVQAVSVADLYVRHYGFLAEQGVNMTSVNVQCALQALLAVASFAGADFGMPSCKLSDLTWGYLEFFTALTSLMWGPPCYFFPSKVLDAYQIESGNAWITISAMYIGLFNMLSCLVSFTLLASKDGSAKAKFVQAFCMVWAVQLGANIIQLNCVKPFKLDQGATLFNAVISGVGLFCGCRAADKYSNKLP